MIVTILLAVATAAAAVPVDLLKQRGILEKENVIPVYKPFYNMLEYYRNFNQMPYSHYFYKYMFPNQQNYFPYYSYQPEYMHSHHHHDQYMDQTQDAQEYFNYERQQYLPYSPEFMYRMRYNPLFRFYNQMYNNPFYYHMDRYNYDEDFMRRFYPQHYNLFMKQYLNHKQHPHHYKSLQNQLNLLSDLTEEQANQEIFRQVENVQTSKVLPITQTQLPSIGNSFAYNQQMAQQFPQQELYKGIPLLQYWNFMRAYPWLFNHIPGRNAMNAQMEMPYTVNDYEYLLRKNQPINAVPAHPLMSQRADFDEKRHMQNEKFIEPAVLNNQVTGRTNIDNPIFTQQNAQRVALGVATDGPQPIGRIAEIAKNVNVLQPVIQNTQDILFGQEQNKPLMTNQPGATGRSLIFIVAPDNVISKQEGVTPQGIMIDQPMLQATTGEPTTFNQRNLGESQNIPVMQTQPAFIGSGVAEIGVTQTMPVLGKGLINEQPTPIVPVVQQTNSQEGQIAIERGITTGQQGMNQQIETSVEQTKVQSENVMKTLSATQTIQQQETQTSNA